MPDLDQDCVVAPSSQGISKAPDRARDFSTTVAGTEISHLQTELLEQHGRFTLAYSLFQPGLKYFHSELGMIAYETRFRCKTIVLADPLAAPDKIGELLDQFLAVHPRPFFCGISHHTAELLSERGFNVNEMGQDVRIHMPTYTLDGPKKQTIRQAWNKFQREEWVVEEWSYGENNAAEVARQITNEWRATRTVADAEMRFLTRPIVYEPEQDVRKFFVKNKAGFVVAFYFFDPIYEGGKVVGYSTSFKRRLPEAMTGMEEAINVWAIKKFAAEGKTWLNLGLIPLYRVEEPPAFKHSWIIRSDMISAKKYADGVYFNLIGQADFKHRFRGEEIPMYVATRRQLDVLGVYGVLGASGVPFSLRKTVQIFYQLGANKFKDAWNKLRKKKDDTV
jgi:lysylphosphatidylglycerol synthetase-like protein (DUF2156 family)